MSAILNYILDQQDMADRKQQSIIDFALANENKITTKQANDLLKRYYYWNHEHYVSLILSRMVKNGKLIREKIGHYKLRDKPMNDKQLTLFQ